MCEADNRFFNVIPLLYSILYSDMQFIEAGDDIINLIITLT